VVISIFRNLFKLLNDFLGALLDGIKYLFIPHSDYFTRLWKVLHSGFSEKFGGITSIVNYLGDRFASMKTYNGLESLFTLRFPKGSLLGGISIDLIEGGLNVLTMIRGAFSGFIVLLTVAYCYRKITSMINT